MIVLARLARMVVQVLSLGFAGNDPWQLEKGLTAIMGLQGKIITRTGGEIGQMWRDVEGVGDAIGGAIGRAQIRANTPPKPTAVSGDDAIYARYSKRYEAIADKVSNPFDDWTKSVKETTAVLDVLFTKKMHKDKAGKDLFGSIGEERGLSADPLYLGLASQYKTLGAGMEIKNPAAMLEGSTAAYSAITKAQNQGGKENVQERMEKLLIAAKQQRDAQIATGKEVAAAIKALKVKGL
jgi:hypothetical protein